MNLKTFILIIIGISVFLGTALQITRSNGAIYLGGTVNIQTFANTTTTGPLYATATSNGQIGYSGSSIRFKENVKDLIDSEGIYQLRPVRFDWKDKTREKNQLGLIAEEVNKIYPEIVWLDKEGIPEGVHYEWLAIPMITEMKKLRDRVKELEVKVNELTNRKV